MAINSIVHADVLDFLGTIPSGSVDVVFADPPFNLKKKYGNSKDNLADVDYKNWCRKWLNGCFRVLKHGGSLFVHNLPEHLIFIASHLNLDMNFQHWISLDFPGQPLGNKLQPNHYGILYYIKGDKPNTFYQLRYPHKRCRIKKCNELLKDYGGKKDSIHPFGPLLSDVWTDIHRIKHNKYRSDHPCQLPVHLLERIILMSSEPGDLILDSFMGTGTTAIAAKQLRRNYIGCDNDSKSVEIANKILMNTKSRFLISQDYKRIPISVYLNRLQTIRNIDWPYIAKLLENKTMQRLLLESSLQVEI